MNYQQAAAKCSLTTFHGSPTLALCDVDCNSPTLLKPPNPQKVTTDMTSVSSVVATAPIRTRLISNCVLCLCLRGLEET